jgi:succinyl-CoA synthetase beta subunit
MKLHEYQAKAFLREGGVPLPAGRVATSPEEAGAVARELGRPVVVKAQVLAGGRGKAGGVKLVATPEAAEAAAREIMSRRLATVQSGAEGLAVAAVLVEEQVPIARELYLAILADRAAAAETVIASASGGMEIEEVAARTPEAILRQTLTPAAGVWPYQARALAAGLGLAGDTAKALHALLPQLLAAYRALDATLLEINPLIVTTDGRLVALDAKITVDDNAAYRQKKVAALTAQEAGDPLELEAARIGVSYIRMDGDIGCVVNGAGLAMTTMDILHLLGGRAANFLDVGGGADAARIAGALRLILTDAAVKTIFVNIFGGILRCDVFAEGFIAAVKESGARVPMVVRLIGTNREEGRRLLTASGLPVIVDDDLESAAARAVAIAGGNAS